MPGNILVTTASTVRDGAVGRVIDSLARRGRRVARLDSARFPLDARLSIGLDGGLWTGETHVSLEDVGAVWHRHLDVAATCADRLDPTWLPPVQRQAEIAIWAFATSVAGLHVDHPDRNDAVPGTPGILRLGRAAGLDVPRTLVSNDPAAIRAFVADCPDGAVRKLLHSSSLRIETDQGTHGGSTEAVDPTELEDDDAVAACPLIWQERVPKARELRVTAVGRRLFVASVDSTGSASGAVDWRQDPTLVRGFSVDTLPPDVEAAIQRLLDRVRLNCATIDIIRTPDGRHVLLEVNTTSFFDFVEDATGMPISEAVADLLAGEAEPRVARDE